MNGVSHSHRIPMDVELDVICEAVGDFARSSALCHVVACGRVIVNELRRLGARLPRSGKDPTLRRLAKRMRLRNDGCRSAQWLNTAVYAWALDEQFGITSCRVLRSSHIRHLVGKDPEVVRRAILKTEEYGWSGVVLREYVRSGQPKRKRGGGRPPNLAVRGTFVGLRRVFDDRGDLLEGIGELEHREVVTILQSALQARTQLERLIVRLERHCGTRTHL